MELPQGVYKEADRGTYTASIYVCGKKIRRRFNEREDAIAARRYAEIYRSAFEDMVIRGMINWEENAKRMLLNPEGGNRMNPIQLSKIGENRQDGRKSLEELYEMLLMKCLEDLKNPNKDMTKKRQIIITLELFNSSEGFFMNYYAKTKMPEESGGTVTIDKETMRELKLQNSIPGQINITDVENTRTLPHDEDGVIFEE